MKTVLLVDDEAIIRQALSRNLNKSGYDVTSAADGTAALACLYEKPYDIIVTDYLMQGMNGLELMTKAKALDPTIKVILFSGFIEQNLDECVHQADCFLSKPIGLNELLDAMENLLAR